MPKFSQESFSKLSTCHSDLQAIFFDVVKSFDCEILEGYRHQDDVEFHGKHYHQPAMAVDVAPNGLDWQDEKDSYWFAGYVMGIAQKLKDEGKITHSIKFGGDCDPKYIELVHFELMD